MFARMLGFSDGNNGWEGMEICCSFFMFLSRGIYGEKTQQIGEYSVVGMERNGIVFCWFVCLLVWMGLGLVTCLFSIFLCDNMVGMFCFLV